MSRLSAGLDVADAWAELWSELHHQGDVGEASYTLQASLAVLAIARGALKMGALIINLDSSELDEILEQQLAWQSLYY